MSFKIYHTASPDVYSLRKENAKEMRKFPTEAESIFWNFVRNHQTGRKFRRQHIIGDYIVDFVDLRSQTIIEIDGGYHNQEEQMEYDLKRTEFFNKIGFSVLRFSNGEVIANIDSVISQILNHINQKQLK